MDCPACGHGNREAAKFCAQCATSLPVACASCGSELRTQAKFCDQCGTPVSAPAESPATPAAARKVVTILFADLVGSTLFGDRVDTESAREAMAEFHTMASEAVESAGGTVAKFIGDGVMALFGAPETAEDDADRAVAAGLALQRGFAPIRDRVASRHGVDLGLRVGINTGEIVLAAGDADLVGDALNTAARLEAACAPGQVLVGEETWRLTRSHVRYVVLGEVDVKGKDDPVAAYQVVDEAVTDDDQATPFVGRVEELARLREVFDDAVGRRSARLATVIGSPGVGKTRIAREFADSLGEAAVVAELRCERAGTATFAPIADLLRTITTIDDEFDPDQVRAALRELVAELDDADRMADLLASFVGAAPARSTEEAFLAVRRLVEATGRRQPLVVVVDDIQWAEPLFLDLLEHLADWVTDAPMLLIGLARPELRELRPSLAEESRTLVASIGLEGLDAAATAELAARLVGADSLPSDLVARLPDSTEGNPLFVRELMRMLVDDGVIEQTASGWQLTIDADAVEVPPTIQSLLAARLDRMPANERRLVELASVVGPEFPLGAVATISDSGVDDLRLALDRLWRRELVESTGLYWGDEPIYRFHHVLIRDAAYRRLLKRARADLHLRVGEWTARTAAGLPGEHEVAIAYHFEQAHEYRRQLDDVDDAMASVGRRAAELLGAAAERSLERDDLPSAAGLAERALARLGEGDALVPSMLVVAAESLLGLGDVGRGRPVVERLSEVVDDDERLMPWSDAFVAQLTMLTEPDRLHEADERADRAAAMLAELGDDAGVAKARLVRAGTLARLGRIGQCEAELDQALTAARAAGDRRRVAAVLGAAPLAALWGPSPIPRAGGRCLDVIRLLRITTGSPAVEATSMRCQAVLEALRGRFDTARSMLSDSRSTVEELGLRHALGETDLFTGIVELLAGDAEAAERPLRSAYQGLGRLGIGADAGQAAAYLARAVLQQGRVDEAEQLAAESAELGGENPQTAIAARSAQAEILAARGRFDEAVAVASDAVARAEGTDIIVDHAAASAVLAQVAGLAGDAATAERAGRIAADLYEQKAATVATPTQAPTARAAEHGDEHVPLNEADRLTRRFIEAFAAGAREEWLPLLSPDQVTLDRRPLVGVDTTGADGVADAWPRDRESGALSSVVETVAVRGESFALVRWRVTSTHGREWDLLHLTRWTVDGLNDLNVIFPSDQRDEALAELDRLHREAGDETEAWNDAAAARTGVDGPVAESPSDFWNDADRLSHGLLAALVGHSAESWFEMLDPDHVSDDRRAFVTDRTEGRDETAHLWRESATANWGDRSATSLETIGARGDHLVLQRLHVETGLGDPGAALQVLRWNDAGLCDLLVRFDGDDVAAATAELDRLWYSSLNQRRQLVSRLAVGLGEAWVAPSTHPFDDLLAPAFGLVDGRTLGMGSLDRAGFEEALRGREADGTTGVPVPSRVQFVSDDVLVFRANNLGHTPESGVEWEEIACNVMVVESDRIARLEMFDEDRWDEAVARAAQISGRPARMLENDATRLRERWLDAASEARGGLFADDFVREDRRTVVAAPDAGGRELPDAMVFVEEMGAHDDLRPAIAVRGENFALFPHTFELDGFSIEWLVVNEVGDGRLRRSVHFDPDDLAAAQDELDGLWAATLSDDDAATLRTAVAFRDAYAALDMERVFGLLGDEFLTVDHRPASWPSMDRERFAAANDDRRAVMGESRIISTEIFFIRNGVILAANELSGRAPDTGTEWSEQFVNVFVAGDGLMQRVESYLPDDLDAARARAEELIAERDVGRPLPNAATHLIDHVVATNGLIDVETIAAEFVRDDRRSTVSAGEAHRDEFVESLRVQNEMGVVWAATALAVRGDRLALSEFTGESEGSTIEMLVVTEVDELGRAARSVHFDQDDLASAQDELDWRYLTTLTDEQATTLRTGLQFRSAMSSSGTAVMSVVLADDFVAIDHRDLAFPDLDRDTFLEINRQRDELFGEALVFTTDIHRIEGDVIVASNRMAGLTPGSGVEWLHEFVNIFVVRDGRLHGLENFGPDDLAAAMSRADALVADHAAPLHHPLEAHADRFVSNFFTEGFDAIRDETFEPDFVREDRRRVVRFPTSGLDEFREAAQQVAGRDGLPTIRRGSLIAVRDNAYVGSATTVYPGGEENQSLIVLVAGPTGRIGRMVVFDSAERDAALDELDGAWLPTLDPADAETYRIADEYARAYREGDEEGFIALVADDVTVIDHRALGFGELDRAGFLELLRSRSSTRGVGTAHVPEVHRLRSGLMVSSYHENSSSADGAEYVNVVEGVTVVRNGRVVRQEFFEPGDVDAAVARAEELLHAAPAIGSTTIGSTRRSSGPPSS